MKSESLWRLKFKAEKDPNLSDGAARLLARIVSERYLSKDRPDEAFPLTWRQVSRWLYQHHDDPQGNRRPVPLSQRQAYRRLDELCTRGYLFETGLQGCPPAQHFRLVFTRPNSASTGRIDSDEKGRTNSDTTGRHLYSSTLRVESTEERATPSPIGHLVAAALAAAEQGT